MWDWSELASSIKTIFVVLCFCISLTAIESVEAKEATFTVCYENIENIPYYYGEGSEVPKARAGLYVDMFEVVSVKLALKISFHRAPWARCLKRLELNQVDGVLAASYKPERAVYSHYPMSFGAVDMERRIVNKAYFLYRRKGSSVSWDGDNFQGIKVVGAQIGYAVIDFLRKYNVTVMETASVQRGFKQLQNQRLEGFATLEAVGNTLLMRYPDQYNMIEKVPTALSIKPYYLLIGTEFYKNHESLSEDIWNTLAQIRETDMTTLLVPYTEQ